MKVKRRIAVPLAIMLAGSVVLAACGTDGDTSATSSPQAGQTPGSTTAEPTPEVRKDITVSIYDRGQVAQDVGTIEDNRWTEWINENGPANVKFVAIPRTNPAERINVLYASGSAPDLLFEFSPTIRNPLYEQRQLLPLDDLIEQHSVEYKQLLEEYPDLRKVGTKSDGNLYEMGRLNWIEPQRGMLIRTDWLEKLDLEAPQTIEDLYNVAKAFAERDPDDNNVKDTYGISLVGDDATFRQMFGANHSWVVKDGQLVRDWERSVEHYTFVKRLYDEGIVDRDFVTDSNGAVARQNFINGKIGIYLLTTQNSTNIVQTLIHPLKANVPTAEVTFLAYPETDSGAFLPTLGNPVQMTAVVSATAKNPDAVIKYVDFLLRESTSHTLLYGIEGEHYNLVGGVPEIIDAAQYKKEVTDVTLDMRLLYSSGLNFNKSNLPIIQYKNDPNKDEYQEFYELRRETFLTLDRPYPELSHSEHIPAPPAALSTAETNAKSAIEDIWLRAIVGGSSYSIEQALADAQDIWRRSDGQQIEDWYREWYNANKDNALLAEGIKDVVRDQTEHYKTVLQEVGR